jgi:uncharacterized protein (TIGR02996 family)
MNRATMNREGEALLRAILDDPDDDVSRLVYADWLAENGDDARGQLIRVQVEAARLAPSREPADRQRFAGLTAEASLLLTRHETRWLAELPHIAGVRWIAPSHTNSGPSFQRGFVNNLACNCWALLREHGPELFALTPIERLSIRIETPAELRELAQTPWLRNLRSLELQAAPLGTQGLSLLAKSPVLMKLQRLDLDRSAGPVSFADVLETPFFRQLDTLCLHQVSIEGGGLFGISQSNPAAFSALRVRRIEWSSPDELHPFVIALFSFLPPRLTWLRLQSQRGDGDLLAASLAQMPRAQQLRRLNLCDNRITDRGALALAECGHLEDLELLDLRNNPIGDRVKRRLRDRFDHEDCRLLLGNEGQP